ncbi:unnamed protein product [Linum tenue]|uniref:Uncharacterized protein n=1 Tax=Linum tenue TaxID=586396 RepID=A0AAV0LSX5_9ROSI|nr:unnamed protein product [Linum tenue]
MLLEDHRTMTSSTVGNGCRLKQDKNKPENSSEGRSSLWNSDSQET